MKAKPINSKYAIIGLTILFSACLYFFGRDTSAKRCCDIQTIYWNSAEEQLAEIFRKRNLLLEQQIDLMLTFDNEQFRAYSFSAHAFRNYDLDTNIAASQYLFELFDSETVKAIALLRLREWRLDNDFIELVMSTQANTETDCPQCNVLRNQFFDNLKNYTE